MSGPLSRRSFVGASAAAASFDFLSLLPRIGADDVKPRPNLVRFDSDIEPLIRLIEDVPRDKLLETIVERIRAGTSPRQLLAADFLAGIRGIQPRPVGFKFHAVLVVNAAHQAAQAARDRDRWLPIIWALDDFKKSQARNKVEGDWRMSAVDEAKVPPSHLAKTRFVEAMEAWDEEAADVAVVSMARNFGLNEIVETFWRFGARDFRDIGHKAIYTAGAWRALHAVGQRHAEPILRSLTYALLDHFKQDNPAKNSYDEDVPGRDNLVRLKKIRKGWLDGKRNDDAVRDLLAALRKATPAEAGDEIVKLLNGNVSPTSIWDALFLAAGELLMRDPGIIGLHCLTSVNGLHYAFRSAAEDDVRRYVLLQAGAFLMLFRKRMNLKKDLFIDRFEKEAPGKDALADVFADVGKDRERAARKALAHLETDRSAEAMMNEARRLIFAKGTDAHDYKLSSAVLEDFHHVSPTWRNRFLAASTAQMRGSGDRDNALIERTRAALK